MRVLVRLRQAVTLGEHEAPPGRNGDECASARDSVTLGGVERVRGDDDLGPLDELPDGTFSPPHLRRSPARRNSAIIAMRMESQLQRVDGDGEARAAPTV